MATYTATVGDRLNFTAYNSVYQGSPEIVNSGGSPTATVFTVNSVAAGTAPAPTVMSIADFNATGDGATAGLPPYAETIVELDNVTLSPTTAMPGSTGNETYTLSDGSSTTSMYAYKSDSAVVAAEEAANAANPTGFNGVYDIVGYADEYYGKAEIYPLSITAVPEPASLGLLAIGGISLLVRRRREV